MRVFVPQDYNNKLAQAWWLKKKSETYSLTVLEIRSKTQLSEDHCVSAGSKKDSLLPPPGLHEAPGL